MKIILKFLAIVGLMMLTAFIAFMILMRILFGPRYDTQDLIQNYEKRTSEIYELKEFIKKITPEKCGVDVEFNSNKSIDLDMWEKSDTAKNGIISWFEEWDINPYNYIPEERSDYDLKYGAKTNSLSLVLEKLNWTNKEFKELKVKLDKANCISISKSDEVYTIGFQRSGMGKYYYKIFDNMNEENIIAEFNDGCTYKYYKENVVLEYGGGAIGSQCFEDFHKEKK